MRALLLAAVLVATVAPRTFADDPSAPPAASPAAKRIQEQHAEMMQALEAAKMLVGFKAGKIQLTPEQVQEYRATLQAYTSAHPRSHLETPAKLAVHNMPLRGLEHPYQIFSGKPVIITERAKTKLITLEAPGPSNEEVVAQIDDVLQKQGFIVTHSDSGTTIDFP